MSWFSLSAPILIVLVLVIIDVFCGDGTNFGYNPNFSRQFPASVDKSFISTPWPALGQNGKQIRNNFNRHNQRIVNYFNKPNFAVISTGNQRKSEGYEGTDDELREFSEVLLTKDVNNVAKYVDVNLQSKTTSRSQVDQAPQPLLTIRPEAYRSPSVQKLMLLYDNYELDTLTKEFYTSHEKQEENDLLEAVISTPVMQHTHHFLQQKGKIGSDPREFKDLLQVMWFNMYSRGRRRVGSSGFEHVFLAEIKNNQVSGLHNWLYFNQEEKRNQANYLGYMKKLDLGNKGAILKYHFLFHGVDKPVGSMFIGTSPEFEMALYTTCFILKPDTICPLKLNGNRFIIRTYTFRYNGKNMIGSAFPEI